LLRKKSALAQRHACYHAPPAMPALVDLEKIFSAAGPLARAIGGFRPRSQQLAMALAVHDAIVTQRALVAEAGTGTGKTFAYLVPALLSGGKVIISTGTKTLQDQLFNRDLPTVRAALGAPAMIALLKGRANYVCPYHLERALAAGRLATREEIKHLHAIARFAKKTASGDKAECSDVPEDSGAWALATSTRENCLGQECPHVKGCFVLAARREALGADVVVVNHHLFFADVMLKDDGMGELLPACNTVIFDEAHQLPEIAGLFFGASCGTGRVIDLARDARLEGIAAAKDYAPLQEAALALEKAAKDLRLVFRDEGRLALVQWQQNAPAAAALECMQQRLDELGRHLDCQADRSEGLANCLRRCQELALSLREWQKPPAAEDDEPPVRWIEVTSHHVTFNLTPLSVASIFKKQLEGHPRAWIFTSATLAVGEDFSHFCNALGLTEAITHRWDSPFDYPTNALLYCPTGMPEPNRPDYPDAVVDAAWPLIRAAHGRAFVLCTSLRAMRRIHALLEERIAASRLDLPLLLQGSRPKSELLESFRRLGNAVLVASQSFWEGVDVPGSALSLVVIDKLPFAPPDDPVLAARIETLKRKKRNAFFEVQLPRAVISMKQGAGRLIRSETDRGVLMVCDPRLVDKPYGRRIWQSLPPMRRTRDLAVAAGFFATLGK